MKTLLLPIEGMHREGCAETIKGLLSVHAGVKASNVSFADARATILFDPAITDRAALVAAIERGGYTIAPPA
jgi:copper chaperone CopZ